MTNELKGVSPESSVSDWQTTVVDRIGFTVHCTNTVTYTEYEPHPLPMSIPAIAGAAILLALLAVLLMKRSRK
mgnify:CR=1 FL=1